MPKDVKRLQIDISLKGFERLKAIKEKTDSPSFADVTNKALKLYEYILSAKLAGKEVKIINPDGTEISLELL